MSNLRLDQTARKDWADWSACSKPEKAKRGSKMKNLILIFSIPFFVLMANVADAFNFYGASITVKEVSMSMWRMGISGNYPIIDSVTLDSPAAKAGLSQGNIILSVNNMAIKNVSDLTTFSTDILSVKILKGYSRETITIDRVATVKEMAKCITEEIKPIVRANAPNEKTEVEALSIDSAPIVLDDAKLDKIYGNNTADAWYGCLLKSNNLESNCRCELRRGSPADQIEINSVLNMAHRVENLKEVNGIPVAVKITSYGGGGYVELFFKGYERCLSEIAYRKKSDSAYIDKYK